VLALLQKRLQGVEVVLTVIDAEADTRTRFDPSEEHSALVANCDDLRLEQVLINLLGNALDATTSDPGGGQPSADVTPPRIEIEIETTEATLAISVHDNGPGIPDDVLPRLFEPFFTTK
jgi:two-component system C4-dicarboxylate transport sensor histidine kinase DctB